MKDSSLMKFTHKDYKESLMCGDLQSKVSLTLKEWQGTINEATDNELGEYLEAKYNISRERLEKYLTHCNNVKLKGVDIHSYHSNPDDLVCVNWVDGGRLIFTTVQRLYDNVYDFSIESYWRKDGV